MRLLSGATPTVLPAMIELTIVPWPSASKATVCWPFSAVFVKIGEIGNLAFEFGMGDVAAGVGNANGYTFSFVACLPDIGCADGFQVPFRIGFAECLVSVFIVTSSMLLAPVFSMTASRAGIVALTDIAF